MNHYGIACDEDQVYESEKVSVPNVRKMLDSMKTASFANLIAIDIIEQGLNLNHSSETGRFCEVQYRDVGSIKVNASSDPKVHINIIKHALQRYRDTFIIEQVNPIIEKVGLKISSLSKTGFVGSFTFSFKVVPLV
ncbi:predicted protein [Chaetoceros tenuissimus]|uniref:Uncharacterized protein n=1 Tax=Chaetoceros tenuissimus TaxID=426638 RepID=A0AAD3HAW0_9STRA|nr:predicted protein [Chaetoceros tenuissimus]